MIRTVLASARQALSRPRPLILVAALLLLVDIAPRVLDLAPRRAGVLLLAALGLGFLRALLELGLQAVALGVVRDEPDAASRVWVRPGKLLQLFLLGIVLGIVLTVVIAIGIALLRLGMAGRVAIAALVVGGLYIMAIVSQYTLLILDGRGEMAEALALSADLIRGHRWQLVAVLIAPLIAGAIPYAFSRAPATAAWFSGFSRGAGVVVLPLYAIAVVVCFACVNAAFYGELLKAHEVSLALPPPAQELLSGDQGWRT